MCDEGYVRLHSLFHHLFPEAICKMQVLHSCPLQKDLLIIPSVIPLAAAQDPAPLGPQNKEFKTEMLVLEMGETSPAKSLTDSEKNILLPSEESFLPKIKSQHDDSTWMTFYIVGSNFSNLRMHLIFICV